MDLRSKQLEGWEAVWNRSSNPRFHYDAVDPTLKSYIEKKFRENDFVDMKCLVPLCGKSRDLLFLQEKGFHTVGVEMVEKPILDLAEESGFKWKSKKVKAGLEMFEKEDPLHCKLNPLMVLRGNFLDLTEETVEYVVGSNRFDFCYDRAAIVAVHPSQRADYAAVLKSLCDEILLLTCSYDQSKRRGAPWSVRPNDVAELFADTHEITVLSSIERPKFDDTRHSIQLSRRET